MRIRLDDGVARAFVPDEGHGFTIDVPGAAYEDVGTEFGVRVDGQASELHVFSGSVKVHEPAGDVTLYEVGRSIRVDQGSIQPAPAPNPADYPTPADLNYLRWQNLRAKLPASDGVIAYFPLDVEQNGTLPNLAPGSVVSDGKLVKTRWVTGRWRQKPSLLFDDPGDRLEMTFDGSWKQATMTLWLKVDRVDVPHTSLLSSDGAEPGDFHWKIGRDGYVEIGLRGQHAWHNARGPKLDFGRWHHLAVVIDLDAERVRFYLDGQPDRESIVKAPAFAPGSVRLGDWLPERGHPAATRARGFHGRIGEFAAWNRTLSLDELASIARSGSPGLQP